MNLAGRIPVPTPPNVTHGCTTPTPVYVQPSTRYGAAPARNAPHEQLRLRTAAHRASRLFPGPIGVYLETELLAAADWGYRLATSSLLAKVVDDIMRPHDPA